MSTKQNKIKGKDRFRWGRVWTFSVLHGHTLDIYINVQELFIQINKIEIQRNLPYSITKAQDPAWPSVWEGCRSSSQLFHQETVLFYTFILTYKQIFPKVIFLFSGSESRG